MKKIMRRYVSVVGVLVVSVSLMLILAAMKSSPQRKPATDDRPTISVLEVSNEAVQITVPVIGRLSAHDRIEMLAEVSGVLRSSGKEFLAGQSYSAGEIMLQIDKEEAELSLKAQRSTLLTSIASLLPDLKFDYPESYQVWSAYLQSFNINDTTKALPATRNEREKFFVSSKGIYNSYYQIKSQEARLDKYTIRAPFDGVLIQSSITPGNLVRSGQPLGTLINPNVYDLETSVSLSDVQYIKAGDEVLLKSNNIPGNWTGRVSRIVQSLDKSNQMVKVYVSVRGAELREQMFLEGTVMTHSFVQGIELPRKMLRNGNEVLEYENGQISYKTANVIATRGEMAIVQGLKDGSLLSKQTLNLLDGTEVRIAGEDVVTPSLDQKKQGKAAL